LEAEVGMLIVEMIAKIRRAFFVQGKPISSQGFKPAELEETLRPLIEMSKG
jgi:hypothetical protein